MSATGSPQQKNIGDPVPNARPDRIRELEAEVERLREKKIHLNNLYDAQTLRRSEAEFARDRLQGEIDRCVESQVFQMRKREEAEARLRRIEEAATKYIGHQHRQFNWQCDSSECSYIAALRDALEETGPPSKVAFPYVTEVDYGE